MALDTLNKTIKIFHDKFSLYYNSVAGESFWGQWFITNQESVDDDNIDRITRIKKYMRIGDGDYYRKRNSQLSTFVKQYFYGCKGLGKTFQAGLHRILELHFGRFNDNTWQEIDVIIKSYWKGLKSDFVKKYVEEIPAILDKKTQAKEVKNLADKMIETELNSLTAEMETQIESHKKVTKDVSKTLNRRKNNLISRTQKELAEEIGITPETFREHWNDEASILRRHVKKVGKRYQLTSGDYNALYKYYDTSKRKIKKAMRLRNKIELKK